MSLGFFVCVFLCVARVSLGGAVAEVPGYVPTTDDPCYVFVRDECETATLVCEDGGVRWDYSQGLLDLRLSAEQGAGDFTLCFTAADLGMLFHYVTPQGDLEPMDHPGLPPQTAAGVQQGSAYDVCRSSTDGKIRFLLRAPPSIRYVCMAWWTVQPLVARK